MAISCMPLMKPLCSFISDDSRHCSGRNIQLPGQYFMLVQRISPYAFSHCFDQLWYPLQPWATRPSLIPNSRMFTTLFDGTINESYCNIQWFRKVKYFLRFLTTSVQSNSVLSFISLYLYTLQYVFKLTTYHCLKVHLCHTTPHTTCNSPFMCSAMALIL